MKCLIFILLATWSQAQTTAQGPQISGIEKQIVILDTIRPVVERLDQARLLVIRNSLMVVIQDRAANLQAGRAEFTFQTLRFIHNVIVQYRFSKTFFGWTQPISINSIYSPSIEKYLRDLHTLSQQMEKDFGLDDSPYTQITANTFRQMQRLLKQLESIPLDNNLKVQLRALWQPIGETIAIAEQGDRPRAFAKATQVVAIIRSLYPQFDQILASTAGFNAVLEIQGLTEFYAEFAQVEE